MTKTPKGISLLTEEQVCEIRKNRNHLTQTQLAEEYGVTQPAISNVINRRSYRDVVCK